MLGLAIDRGLKSTENSYTQAAKLIPETETATALAPEESPGISDSQRELASKIQDALKPKAETKQSSEYVQTAVAGVGDAQRLQQSVRASAIEPQNIEGLKIDELPRAVPIQGLKLPDAATIRTAPLAEIQEIYRECRRTLEEAALQMRESLSNMGLSGRGEKDLMKILTQQAGTYGPGGKMMVYALSQTEGLSPEQLYDNLEEAGFRAAKSATLQNKERMTVDPIPGGVMVTWSQEMSVSVNERSAWLRPGTTPAVGETTIPLVPSNFDQAVRGVIGFERFAEFRELMNEFDGVMSATGPEQDGRILGETPEAREQRIAEYNDAYYRNEFAERFTGMAVARDAMLLMQAPEIDLAIDDPLKPKPLMSKEAQVNGGEPSGPGGGLSGSSGMGTMGLSSAIGPAAGMSADATGASAVGMATASAGATGIGPGSGVGSAGSGSGS